MVGEGGLAVEEVEGRVVGGGELTIAGVPDGGGGCVGRSGGEDVDFAGVGVVSSGSGCAVEGRGEAGGSVDGAAVDGLGEATLSRKPPAAALASSPSRNQAA